MPLNAASRPIALEVSKQVLPVMHGVAGEGRVCGPAPATEPMLSGTLVASLNVFGPMNKEDQILHRSTGMKIK